MPPLIFNPGKHGEMRPWLSVFLAPLRAIFFSFQAAEEGGGSRSPSPWALVPAAWGQSGERQPAPSAPMGNTLHPVSAMSISGRKTFLCTVLTSRFPLGLSGSVCTPFQGESPHSTFWPFEKCITKIQICSACCLRMLSIAFAVEPCGTLKALSLECLCV